jgi:hypothetical protein
MEEWKSADGVVANFSERKFHSVIFASEAQYCLGTPMLFKHIAKICATLTVLFGFLLELLKLR